MKKKSIFVLVFIGAVLSSQMSYAGMVYSNDFEGSVGSEWSSTTTDITPGTPSHAADKFLGQFWGSDTVSLTLNNLPSHAELTVSFDLYIIQSWDGNNDAYGPDIWDLSVSGGPTLLHTTFANSVGIRTQSYPDSYPNGDYESRTGAAENDTLGFTYHSVSFIRDSVYRFYGTESLTFSHSGSSVVLNFSGNIHDVFPNQESWGIDNVQVTPEPATILLLTLGGLVLRKNRR
ncbi:MAG: PEP-CTERM sorting domain-containing protein [Planctomycetes bacterium]|nr:PEP-CTERM sorting domain-containing protein [Planctomycetota bacterium]MBU1517510.1 PEP-CTERM sorting domain-containing protein [Planctomycetota bacterium]MBU2457344.1 PEP-CTERM sorting domain-containing protein [Planctomycetota bacterium]